MEAAGSQDLRTSLTKTGFMRTTLLLWTMSLLLICCHKVPDTSQLSNDFAVITNRDTRVSFADYKTFVISDTVSFISNVPSDDTLIIGDPALVILNTVKNNLKSNGYVQVDRFAKPDLGVKVTVIKQVEAGTISGWGWWWSSPGYPGACYWGWCYLPSSPYQIAYAYHIGDLIIEVFDLKHAAQDQQLHDIWLTNAAGVLSSTTQENIDKSILAIDQAFAQSPYFKTN